MIYTHDYGKTMIYTHDRIDLCRKCGQIHAKTLKC